MTQQQDPSNRKNPKPAGDPDHPDRVRGGTHERPMDDPGRGQGDPFEELLPDTTSEPKPRER